MMSIVIKSHIQNNVSIDLVQENNLYKVSAYETYGVLCGYPFIKRFYSLNELDKAKRTYNRYIKKYCQNN